MQQSNRSRKETNYDERRLDVKSSAKETLGWNSRESTRMNTSSIKVRFGSEELIIFVLQVFQTNTELTKKFLLLIQLLHYPLSFILKMAIVRDNSLLSDPSLLEKIDKLGDLNIGQHVPLPQVSPVNQHQVRCNFP
jgi:hypothetical protein